MQDKYDKLLISTTDTVLGIGGPVSKEIEDLIYEIKGRDRSKKLIILVSSIKQAREFKQWNDKAEELAQKYWPGAYTLVINDQGFRMPNQKELLDYLEKNGPIYMSSCNLSNQPVCKTIENAKILFPQIKKVFNFGEMTQQPSTIIRVEDGKILRP
ncbi:L-threonylcarbamoyladenylate synthase [Mycoplasma struthionis]|uniref:L-threonylcarbamoyladenylate synthase n=1 Tax=Mycoplasma struthionis TaxID=538220 RepID=A0A3G8LG26_9MOLU|nr:Sua5/YciO/YrdC/YwlC family protein [Mycoplasma struthionis]AZG68613.1 Sua5/YciO/YrdC/YwlC family protein [Mycoplasma struthionis]TPI02268.1 Sua5/YciO/YrdC/YwlC family protein [Mycoplasma struthionis]